MKQGKEETDKNNKGNCKAFLVRRKRNKLLEILKRNVICTKYDNMLKSTATKFSGCSNVKYYLRATKLLQLYQYTGKVDFILCSGVIGK